jgi:hypothetical protein
VESVSNVWAIGNGISRQNFQLRKIQDWTIGCNAIHRDYKVNEIVAVDRRMVNEIMGNEDYVNVPIHTRASWMVFFKDHPQIRTVPDLPYAGHNKHDKPDHWNSGPYAVLLAVLKQPQTVNLLGFDLYGIGKTYNNLYMNTPNYGKAGDRPVGHSFWIVQLAKLFELNPGIEFIQWQRPNWQIPFQWKSFKNLTIRDIPV